MKIPVRMDGSPEPEDGSLAPEDAEAEGGNGGEPAAAEDWKDRFVRLSADFDNFRRHANIEHERLSGLGKEAVLEDVVPLVGYLERARQSVETAPDKDAILAGLDLIYKQLIAALEKHGIERIPAQGRPFDPTIHEAIGVYACNDAPDNTVIEEVKPGFRRHGKVIRPASVVVAQKKLES